MGNLKTLDCFQDCTLNFDLKCTIVPLSIIKCDQADRSGALLNDHCPADVESKENKTKIISLLHKCNL